MEPGHGSGTNSDLNTHPGQAEKALVYSQSFTSSSSSDNFEESFEINGNEFTKMGAADGSRLSGEQVMESEYRIPASVFETSKSTQMDWSTASTESLFSIHTSFNADAPFLSSENTVSSPVAHEPAARKSCNVSVGPTEAAAAQTMQEVIRENEERTSTQQPVVAKPAEETKIGVQSFAFDAVLTTEGAHSKGKRKSQPLTPPTPKPHQQPPTPKQQNPKTAQKKWRSCFSWCPFCK